MDPIPGPTPSSPPPNSSTLSPLHRNPKPFDLQAPVSINSSTNTTSPPPSRFAVCLSFFSRCGEGLKRFCTERMDSGCFLLLTIPFRLSRNEPVIPVAVFAHPFWLYFWIMEAAVSLHRGLDHLFSSFIVLGPVLMYVQFTFLLYLYSHNVFFNADALYYYMRLVI